MTTSGESLAILAALAADLRPREVWPWWARELATKFGPAAISEAIVLVDHHGHGDAAAEATAALLRMVAEVSPTVHDQRVIVPPEPGPRHRRQRRKGHQ